MIRRATHQDVPTIAAMLREMYVSSKYAGRCSISEKTMDSVLNSLVASQSASGPNASFLRIALQDGKPAGFIAGVLARIYLIGDRLEAQDLFFYVRDGASPRIAPQLLDQYLEWARGHRQVIEIKASWNDTMPGAERAARLFERKGLRKVGEVYEARVDGAQMAEAA